MRERKVIIGESDWQVLFGLLRLFLLVSMPLAIGFFGAARYDGINPGFRTDQIVNFFPLLTLIRPLIWLFVAILESVRFWFIPVGTIAGVFLAAAMFVKDIYDLKHTRHALTYVVASMFGTDYPALIIDKGKLQVRKHEENLLVKVGGPGRVLIEPGNAVIFRSLRGPTDVSLTSAYFLPPFDTIAQVISLEEQQADKDEVKAMTRDGIKVVISDIHFRYRIRHVLGKNGKPASPTLENPYPILDEAIENMAFNLSVESTGIDRWNTAVERVVVGAITDFVAANYIDFLTTPREGNRNPRVEIRNELFFRGIQPALANLGAELLWADVGHVDVEDPSVDDSHTHLWAADWVDDANAIRAFGEAKRAAYLELGRAEAQAEMIMSITDVVAKVAQDSGGNIDIRKILLMRTTQVLDAMTEKEKGKENENGNGAK
jgi:hypothetical protein